MKRLQKEGKVSVSNGKIKTKKCNLLKLEGHKDRRRNVVELGRPEFFPRRGKVAWFLMWFPRYFLVLNRDEGAAKRGQSKRFERQN